MGKFFGLMACLVTVAATTGCGKASDATTELNKLRADLEQKRLARNAMFNKQIADLKEDHRQFSKRLNSGSCRKTEDEQKIPENLLPQAKDIELQALEQHTVYVDCEGKENDVGPIKYITRGSTIIPGLQTADVVTSVEVSSERSCVAVDAYKAVADVTQEPENSILQFEADGDIRVPLSNSFAEGITVFAGKNLLKVKYFNCAESKEVKKDDGTIVKECAKNNLLDQKQVVLNVALTIIPVEGIRRVDLCTKPKETAPATEKPKTDVQE